MRNQFIAGVVLGMLILGCSATNNKSNTPAGWTSQQLTDSKNLCVQQVSSQLSQSSSASAICQCWINAVSGIYTWQQLNTNDTSVESQTQSQLATCASSQGESLEYNILRALRAALSWDRSPQSDDHPTVPRALIDVLKRVRRKQAVAPKPVPVLTPVITAAPVSAGPHGNSSTSTATAAPVRPTAPPVPVEPEEIVKPFAHLTEQDYIEHDSVLEGEEHPVIYGRYLRKDGYSHTLNLNEATCQISKDALTGDSQLEIELKQGKDRVVVVVQGYDKNRPLYARTGGQPFPGVSHDLGDGVTVIVEKNKGTADEANFIQSDEENVKSGVEVTDLIATKKKISGHLVLHSLAGMYKRDKDAAAPGPFPFTSLEGDFTCKIVPNYF